MFGASRSRNAPGHLTRATLRGNLKEKCLNPHPCELAQSKRKSKFHRSQLIRKFAGKMPHLRSSSNRRHRVCASLWHLNMSREPLLTQSYRKNPAPQIESRTQTRTFARASATEMYVSFSNEPLYTEIYRQNASSQLEHPDQVPSVWTRCLGNILYISIWLNTCIHFHIFSHFFPISPCFPTRHSTWRRQRRRHSEINVDG